MTDRKRKQNDTVEKDLKKIKVSKFDSNIQDKIDFGSKTGVKHLPGACATANTQPLVSTSVARKNTEKRLTKQFYEVKCEDLAKALLGKHLVRKSPTGDVLSGIIVETEAYLGEEDKAAHSYEGKKTNKNEAMFMDPGTAYVYNIYGMYCCMNISSQGDGAAVLIRALEPVTGIHIMSKNRSKKRKEGSKPFQLKELCNGPSKLCQSLEINKDSINKVDMTTSSDIWLESGEDIAADSIVASKRINIEYAKEWADKPLRFYVSGNSNVS